MAGVPSHTLALHHNPPSFIFVSPSFSLQCFQPAVRGSLYNTVAVTTATASIAAKEAAADACFKRGIFDTQPRVLFP